MLVILYNKDFEIYGKYVEIINYNEKNIPSYGIIRL